MMVMMVMMMMMMMRALSRSPVDILQFIAVVHASQGTNITNLRPDQLEHEVVTIYIHGQYNTLILIDNTVMSLLSS